MKINLTDDELKLLLDCLDQRMLHFDRNIDLAPDKSKLKLKLENGISECNSLRTKLSSFLSELRFSNPVKNILLVLILIFSSSFVFANDYVLENELPEYDSGGSVKISFDEGITSSRYHHAYYYPLIQNDIILNKVNAISETLNTNPEEPENLNSIAPDIFTSQDYQFSIVSLLAVLVGLKMWRILSIAAGKKRLL